MIAPTDQTLEETATSLARGPTAAPRPTTSRPTDPDAVRDVQRLARPAPAITGTAPDSPANDNDPEVEGATGAGAPTLVKLYTNAACTASRRPPAPLLNSPRGSPSRSPPTHTTELAARATDDALNDSDCSAPFPYSEDSTGPETVLTGGLPAKIKALPRKRALRAGRTRGGTLKLSFYATESVPGFECRLDNGAYGPCSPPLVLTRLKRRAHTFRVRAVDAAGNVDPTPASHRFWVVKKKKR